MLLHLQACVVDLDQMRVQRGDEDLSLTGTEARLLRYLLAHAGKPVDHDRLLRDVWGYSPKARSRTVRTTISRLRAKIEADPSSPRTLVTVVGEGYRLNVPRPVSGRGRLLGRDAEVRDLVGLAQGSLVTILGPAGVGKTRVALELVAELRGEGTEVVFCEVGTADTSAELVDRVASALAVAPGADPVTQIGHALNGRRPLVLVLDEMERLVDHAADTVGRWLALAPELRVICTSRTVLGLPAEQAYSLPTLGADASVELFLRRARQARPGLEVDASARAFARDIVAEADHLPLAIELAAGWVDLVDLASLRARLTDRLATLRDHRATGRHASLEAALAQSWDLLDGPDRAVLAGLSPFVGPFDISAAEAVTGGSGALLPALRRLVDRSWLRRTGDGRMAMLASVRDFVVHRMPQEAREARDRQLALLLAGRIGGDDDQLADALSAVRHGLDTDPEAGARLLLRLDPVLEERGAQLLRHELLELACARVPDAPDDLWVRLHVALGAVSSTMRRSVTDVLDEAVARARRSGDPALLAHALTALGEADAWAGSGRSLALLQEALDHARAAGDERLQVVALRWLALQARTDGHDEANTAYTMEARALAERLGDRVTLAQVLQHEGATHLLQGRLAQAAVALNRARQLDRSPRCQANVDLYLGSVYIRQRKLERGFELVASAARFFHAHGEPRMEGLALGRCAEARLKLGDVEGALEYNGRGKAAVLPLGTPRVAVFDLAYAQIHFARGELDLARLQAVHSIGVWEEIGEDRHVGVGLTVLGRIEHAAGDLHAAVEAYERAVDLLPSTDIYATTSRAWWAACLAEMGRPADAVEVAPAMAVLEADEEPDRRTSNVLCLLTATDPGSARAMLDRLRETPPVGAYQTAVAVGVVDRALRAAGV